jgi:hypothetical protein
VLHLRADIIFGAMLWEGDLLCAINLRNLRL